MIQFFPSHSSHKPCVWSSNSCKNLRCIYLAAIRLTYIQVSILSLFTRHVSKCLSCVLVQNFNFSSPLIFPYKFKNKLINFALFSQLHQNKWKLAHHNFRTKMGDVLMLLQILTNKFISYMR